MESIGHNTVGTLKSSVNVERDEIMERFFPPSATDEEGTWY
jgi:hypothetical protein